MLGKSKWMKYALMPIAALSVSAQADTYVALFATADLAVDEQLVVQWIPARIIITPGVDEVLLDLDLHVRVSNTMDSACSQAETTTVPAGNGINILTGYLVQTDDSLVLNLGDRSFELGGCFDGTRRLSMVLSTPIPVPGNSTDKERKRDTVEKARVVGGLVIGPENESRSPIGYGDFSGTTVMYLDVEEN